MKTEYLELVNRSNEVYGDEGDGNYCSDNDWIISHLKNVFIAIDQNKGVEEVESLIKSMLL